jgi:hypothetical protein
VRRGWEEGGAARRCGRRRPRAVVEVGDVGACAEKEEERKLKEEREPDYRRKKKGWEEIRWACLGQLLFFIYILYFIAVSVAVSLFFFVCVSVCFLPV